MASPKNSTTIQEVIMRKTGGKLHVGPAARHPAKVHKNETLRLHQSASINIDLDECKSPSPDLGNLQIVNSKR